MKTFTWADAAHSSVRIDGPNGALSFVPADHANLDYAGIVAASTEIAPYVAPPAAISDVSDRQFFQQLAIAGKITQDEALAYVGPGALPQAIVQGVAQLPADEQFTAKMLLVGASTFERSSPLANQLGAILGLSPADLDAIWTAAALL